MDSDGGKCPEPDNLLFRMSGVLFGLETTASELILEWGRRSEAQRAESGGWGSWGGAVSPSHQLVVCGSAVSSPAGSRTQPRPTKGFIVFCAVRLLFPASQYLLHTVCMARYIRFF